ncbi:TatD family hydrolase [bacterium]|jgi:TatD DNase family protein|nr:TatD family hydrolase [bacterium]
MIDTHAHLFMCKETPEQLVSKAKLAGIRRIIQIAVDFDSNQTVLDMAAEFPELEATVGIHPLSPDDFDKVADLEGLLTQYPSICAVGETGLDRKYSDDVVAQEKAFRQQIELALAFDKPVVIHNRQADEDCHRILLDYPTIRAVFHCFSSDMDFITDLMDKLPKADLMVSFTGMITFSKRGKVIEAVRSLPLDRLMIETDCPYLTPKLYMPNKNQPAYVGQVANKIADVRDLRLSEVIEATSSNAIRFFGLKETV